MTVGELGHRMSSAEFTDWQRFAEVEPFGPLADGAAAAAYLNYHRDPKKRPEAFTAAEALRMFAYDPPTPEQLAASQVNSTLARLMSLGTARPRTVTRKPK